MPRQIKIRIYPDGHVEAETVGIKGKACKDFVPVLEELLEAKAVSTELTGEYFETETHTSQNAQIIHEQPD